MRHYTAVKSQDMMDHHACFFFHSVSLNLIVTQSPRLLNALNLNELNDCSIVFASSQSSSSCSHSCLAGCEGRVCDALGATVRPGPWQLGTGMVLKVGNVRKSSC